MHAGVSPAQGHSGFHELVISDQSTLGADHYFHYLHHRLFTVNFGVQELPLDWMFNTHHDGSPESHARINKGRRGKTAEAK